MSLNLIINDGFSIMGYSDKLTKDESCIDKLWLEHEKDLLSFSDVIYAVYYYNNNESFYHLGVRDKFLPEPNGSMSVINIPPASYAVNIIHNTPRTNIGEEHFINELKELGYAPDVNGRHFLAYHKSNLCELWIPVIDNARAEKNRIKTQIENELHIEIIDNRIDLSYKNLDIFPEIITHFSDLYSLNLSFNNLAQIPESIKKFKNLHHLYLCGNKLEEIPDSILQLKSLKTLDFRDNKIKLIPKSIESLNNLEYLNLYNNNISTFPQSITNLSNLFYLNLSKNAFNNIPDIIGKLKKLQFLILQDLTLDYIPKGMLNLNLNFINSTTTSFFTDRTGIDIYGTKLKAMDKSIFSGPLSAIKAFYNGHFENLNECKIIFLGDGYVGKTSLIQSIMDGKCAETKTTNGVHIRDWLTKIANISNVTVHFWDFGGQELMHSMHSCFLTQRTFYVVVLDARADNDINRIATKWLENIATFAPNCPVIIVINKIDLNENAAIDEFSLNKKYNVMFIKTSATENKGIDELIMAIHKSITDNGGCSHLFNKNWANIKRELENMDDNYISEEIFSSICKRNDIKETDIQAYLLDFFKDIGVSYYYKGNCFYSTMEEIRVLKPRWLTNGIYRLILRTPTENGILKYNIINEIMGKPHPDDIDTNICYSYKEVDFILNVMRQFGISYAIPNRNEEFIPLKLGVNSPNSVNNFDIKTALCLSWESKFVPDNILHLLMIKMFNDIDFNCIWRNGVLFKAKDLPCSALVTKSEESIEVYVSSDIEKGKLIYLQRIRAELIIIISSKYNCEEYVHYEVKGKKGKQLYKSIFNPYCRNRQEVYLADIEEFANPAEILSQVYAKSTLEKMTNELVAILQEGGNIFMDNSQKIEIGGNNSGNISQNINCKAHCDWPKNIPDDDLFQFIAMLKLFIVSEQADELKRKDCIAVENLVEQVDSNQSDTKTRWNKIRLFFNDIANATTIGSAITAFLITNGNQIGSWMLNLFK